MICPPVAQEQRGVVGEGVTQAVRRCAAAGRSQRHRQGVAAHQGRQGQAQFIEQPGGGELPEQRRAAFAENRLKSLPLQLLKIFLIALRKIVI